MTRMSLLSVEVTELRVCVSFCTSFSTSEGISLHFNSFESVLSMWIGYTLPKLKRTKLWASLHNSF